MSKEVRVKEFGVSGLNYAGDHIFEEFLPQLRWPQAARVYQEMAENDPTIGAVLYMSEQLIRTARWKVVPGGKTKNDERAAQFLEECMNDMEHTWEDFLCEVLSCFVYGWSFHEVVYKLRLGKQSGPNRSRFDDGRIGWRKLPIRSQHTLFGWEFSPDGDVLGMKQMAPPNWGVVTIPMSKGLLFRTRVARNNPEGRSLLRNAYRPWYFKKKIEEIEGIGIERDLAGLPVIQPPEGVDIWSPDDPQAVQMGERARQVVRDVRRDHTDGLVLPYGWDFKLVSTGGSRQFDTNAIINRYDQRIAITMLSDLVMLGSGQVGSFALAEVKRSLLSSSLESLLAMIADVINEHAVRQLFELNNFAGLEEIPRLVPGEVETPNLKELGDFFRATGMKIDDDFELTNYLRQVASLPEITKEQFEELQQKREALRNQTQNATNSHTNNMEAGREKSETGDYNINQNKDKERKKEFNGKDDV